MTDPISEVVVPLTYLLSAVLFIFGLKRLSRVRTARRGNTIAAIAMLLAILGTLLEMGFVDYQWILAGLAVGGAIGAYAAVKVPMTSMPEMVAIFNGFGGSASALVAMSIVWREWFQHPEASGTASDILGTAPAVTTALSVIIGGVTFSGSVVAYLKLQGKISGQPILLPGRHILNILLGVSALGLGGYFSMATADPMMAYTAYVSLACVALVLGVMLVIPIGGADMPVVVSLLNSYSGLAASATGFVLSNNLLIISGALVGAAGLILTQIMCAAMNRSLANVLFGGFGAEPAAGAKKGGKDEYTNVRSYTAEDAAMVLESAESVAFVPGYGLAVAQAQHNIRELATLLEKNGAKVTYGIHPVAGRMPGHMNVLLAEADVPYEQLIEMDDINPEMSDTDVVLVVGANDVVNPAAEKDKDSPIWGMPIIQVHHAQTVMVIKRSLSPGFAGIKNELFEHDNTMMIFGDAKKVLKELASELQDALNA